MKDLDGKRDQEQNQAQDQENQEPEELDLDREEAGEDDWEDGQAPSSGWLRVLFIMGLILLIVVISAGIWYITHPAGQNENEHVISGDGTQNSESIPESPSDDFQQPPSEPGESPTEDPSAGQPTAEDPGENFNPEEDAEKDAEKESDTQVLPDSDAEASQETSGGVSMSFTETKTEVMPKDVVNLRTAPDTTDEGNIAAQAVNGEILLRTGINYDTGWSRIDYNGQTLYAVSSYLTTDMEDTGQEAPPQGPVYTPVNERVTAKIETNLRLQPGTESDDTVVGLLKNGEVLTRTAIGDNGWSQLDYNGQTVYAVSSFLTAAE